MCQLDFACLVMMIKAMFYRQFDWFLAREARDNSDKLNCAGHLDQHICTCVLVEYSDVLFHDIILL